MASAEDFDRLKLFIEKFEYLRSLSLVRTLVAKGSSLQMSWTAETQRLEFQVKEPHPEQVDAFVLTMQLFMQDNDQISLRNMAAALASLPVGAELQALFAMHRDNLNRYLDSHSVLSIDGQELSHRTILTTVVYGQLSHLSPEHRQRFLAWRTVPIMERMVTFEFIGVLIFFLRTLAFSPPSAAMPWRSKGSRPRGKGSESSSTSPPNRPCSESGLAPSSLRGGPPSHGRFAEWLSVRPNQ